MNIELIFNIAVIAGVVIYGIFALVGFFDKNNKEKKDLQDKTDDRVIELLKEQVDALEAKVKAQSTLLSETNIKIEALISENKVMKSILQGKDDQTILFQKMGFEFMKNFEPTEKAILETHRNVEKLYKAIEKHMAAIEVASVKPVTLEVKAS